jgi:signal transduction histidine kinase
MKVWAIGMGSAELGNMRDTEVNASEETLRRDSLSKRLGALGSLAQGVSHELHNPLNCALLQLAVLQRRLEQPDCEPASLQPIAGLVEHALQRLKLLFNDFVFLLQPPAGGRASLAVGDRCPAVVSLVHADADPTGVRVSLGLMLELPPADGRLSLLLANLSPAFVKESPGGGETVLETPRPEPLP